jgi:hypothetical protein
VRKACQKPKEVRARLFVPKVRRVLEGNLKSYDSKHMSDK